MPSMMSVCEPIDSDYSIAGPLAMWTFGIGAVHFTIENSVYSTLQRGVGMGMAVGVPAVSLVWMAVAQGKGWYAG